MDGDELIFFSVYDEQWSLEFSYGAKNIESEELIVKRFFQTFFVEPFVWFVIYNISFFQNECTSLSLKS